VRRWKTSTLWSVERAERERGREREREREIDGGTQNRTTYSIQHRDTHSQDAQQQAIHTQRQTLTTLRQNFTQSQILRQPLDDSHKTDKQTGRHRKQSFQLNSQAIITPGHSSTTLTSPNPPPPTFLRHTHTCRCGRWRCFASSSPSSRRWQWPCRTTVRQAVAR
jgi:hypothetical protein